MRATNPEFPWELEFEGTRSNWPFFVQTSIKPDGITEIITKKGWAKVSGSQKKVFKCSWLVCNPTTQNEGSLTPKRVLKRLTSPSQPPSSKYSLTTLKLKGEEYKVLENKASERNLRQNKINFGNSPRTQMPHWLPNSLHIRDGCVLSTLTRGHRMEKTHKTSVLTELFPGGGSQPLAIERHTDRVVTGWEANNQCWDMVRGRDTGITVAREGLFQEETAELSPRREASQANS